jgi:hypothetical protein
MRQESDGSAIEPSRRATAESGTRVTHSQAQACLTTGERETSDSVSQAWAGTKVRTHGRTRDCVADSALARLVFGGHRDEVTSNHTTSGTRARRPAQLQHRHQCKLPMRGVSTRSAVGAGTKRGFESTAATRNESAAIMRCFWSTRRPRRRRPTKAHNFVFIADHSQQCLLSSFEQNFVRRL